MKRSPTNQIARRCAAFTVALVLSVGALATAGAPSTHAADQASGDVAVVVHPSVPLNGLKAADLHKLLLGDRRFWSGRLRVTLLIRAPGAPERTAFIKGICRMTEPQFRQYWIGMVFRGQATSGPKVTYNNNMAQTLVRVIPGALALVAAKDLKPGVKVLKIDGKSPGDPGYPLK